MAQITWRLEINGEKGGSLCCGYLLHLGVESEVGGVDGGQPGVTAGHGDHHVDQEGEHHDDLVTGH